jgi:hypothetical protein
MTAMDDQWHFTIILITDYIILTRLHMNYSRLSIFSLINNKTLKKNRKSQGYPVMRFENVIYSQ